MRRAIALYVSFELWLKIFFKKKVVIKNSKSTYGLQHHDSGYQCRGSQFLNHFYWLRSVDYCFHIQITADRLSANFLLSPACRSCFVNSSRNLCWKCWQIVQVLNQAALHSQRIPVLYCQFITVWHLTCWYFVMDFFWVWNSLIMGGKLYEYGATFKRETTFTDL